MAKTKKQKPKQLIGKRTWVDFPELGITGICAKIDTGAYYNTLHCSDIYITGGKLFFKVLDTEHPAFNQKEYCFTDFFQKKIKNSFGEMEERFLIKTKIRIANRRIKSILSLTNRGKMKYPVLIGRRLLKNKFIVDVSLKND